MNFHICWFHYVIVIKASHIYLRDRNFLKHLDILNPLWAHQDLKFSNNQCALSKGLHPK